MHVTHLPADVGVPLLQDALCEGRGLQLVLVKREVLYQQRRCVFCVEQHNGMDVTRRLKGGAHDKGIRPLRTV